MRVRVHVREIPCSVLPMVLVLCPVSSSPTQWHFHSPCYIIIPYHMVAQNTLRTCERTKVFLEEKFKYCCSVGQMPLKLLYLLDNRIKLDQLGYGKQQQKCKRLLCSSEEFQPVLTVVVYCIITLVTG